jgi:hypothetical protein
MLNRAAGKKALSRRCEVIVENRASRCRDYAAHGLIAFAGFVL